MAVTNFDIDLLRAFLTVYEEGSFTKASEKLLRTQSAVSLQIRRLENLVGKQLIVRDARKLRLTVDGQQLQRYAKLMVRLNDRAMQHICAPSGAAAITIGIPDDYVSTFMPVLTRLIEEHAPGSPIDIVCHTSPYLRSMFDAGDLDIIVVTEPINPGNPAAVLVDDLCWVRAPESGPSSQGILPLALFPDGCLFRSSVLAALKENGIEYRIVKSSLNFLVLKAALFEGAMSVLARHTITEDLEIIGKGLPALPRVQVAFYSNLPYAAAVQEKLAALMETIRCSRSETVRPTIGSIALSRDSSSKIEVGHQPTAG